MGEARPDIITAMKIYTKTGDDGSTGLVGGARVRKSDLRIECFGTADELKEIFSNLPALEPQDVVGWWDPARTVRLQCEARFLLESLPVDAVPFSEEQQTSQSSSAVEVFVQTE